MSPQRKLVTRVRGALGIYRLVELRERLDEAGVAIEENSQLDVLLAQRVSELEDLVGDLAHRRLRQDGARLTGE